MALLKFLMKLDVTAGLVDIWRVLDTVFSRGPFLWSGTQLDAGSLPPDGLPEDRLAFTASSSASTSTACCLESKSQRDPQAHLSEILERGSGGAVSG